MRSSLGDVAPMAGLSETAGVAVRNPRESGAPGARQARVGRGARRRTHRRVGLLASALIAFVAALVVSAPAALAQGSNGGGGSGYYVTFVARYCHAYTDIFANRQRNNIQESLKDLGPDSQYDDSGVLVNPVDESEYPQSKCNPLPGWVFTLGHGYVSRAVSGPWGSLSKVTDPFPRLPVTHLSTPLLDQDALPVDRERLYGAVTIELTKQERAQANTPDQLWVQGGTPKDPVLTGLYPGPTYGFGALRCATDNLNGDNVEYIFFPAGVRHVFCFAYYVKPAPTSGLITIKKQVVGAPPGENPSFPFSGTISFDPNGFTLANGESIALYRAGGATWNVTEGRVDNYRLSSLVCVAKTSSGGPGKSTTTVTGSTAAINLVASESVTCTYTNAYVPPPGGLSIRKVTTGGVGSFTFVVRSASGHTRVVKATTTEPGVPVDAVPSLTSLPPGTYTIRERPTPSTAGRWKLVAAHCGDVSESTSKAITVEIKSGTNTECIFRNVFIPRGSISITKTTVGATGVTSFLINSRSGPAVQYLQHATTTSSGVPANAIPATPADATDHLRLGSYAITEQFPASTPAGGWSLETVVCNGSVEPFEQGTVEVKLTAAQPNVHCAFTNVFTTTPQPPTPPTPPPTPPTPPPTPPAPPYQVSDLMVTKHATPTVAAQDEVVSYRISVKNLGPDAAERVELTDRILGQLVSANSPAGRCAGQPRVVCALGTIKAGATVVVTIRVRLNLPPSTLINRAVVGTATDESNLANNVATAKVKVIKAPVPPPGRG